MTKRFGLTVGFLYSQVSILLMVVSLAVMKVMDMPSTYIVMLRGVVAWLFLSLFFPKREMFRLQDRDHYVPMIAGGVCLSFIWLFFAEAVKWAPIGIVLCTYFLFPLLYKVALLYTPSRITTLDLLEMIGYGACAYFIVPEWTLENDVTLGITLAALGACAMVLQNLMAGQVSQEYDHETILRYQWAVAAVIFLPYNFTLDFTIMPINVAWVLILGGVCTYLAHGIFSASMMSVQLHYLFMTLKFQPLWGLLLGFLVFGQTVPSSVMWIVLVITVLGILRSYMDLLDTPVDQSMISENARYSKRMQKRRLFWEKYESD